MLACSNAQTHSWSGLGTHYASGTVWSGPDTGTGSDSGDTGLAPLDTSLHQGSGMTPVSSSCTFQTEPQIGKVIDCTSTWSTADATLLVGGTETYNLLDSTGATSISTATLGIVDQNPTATDAIIDTQTGILFFYLTVSDTSVGYQVYLYVTAADGVSGSSETPYTVAP